MKTKITLLLFGMCLGYLIGTTDIRRHDFNKKYNVTTNIPLNYNNRDPKSNKLTIFKYDPTNTSECYKLVHHKLNIISILINNNKDHIDNYDPNTAYWMITINDTIIVANE